MPFAGENIYKIFVDLLKAGHIAHFSCVTKLNDYCQKWVFATENLDFWLFTTYEKNATMIELLVVYVLVDCTRRKSMRLNVYDTFEDEVEMMNLAKQLQNEGMESMKTPHLWATEPIKALKSTAIMAKKFIES